MDVIIVNRIQCIACKDIIESNHVHDFKMCKCGSCGVDGGLEYARRIGENYIELTEWCATDKYGNKTIVNDNKY